MSIVKWREWNDETFAAAQAEDKPILLDIGAVWCHWCHVMDDGIPGDPVHTGTYSDPEIARLIHEGYIPVKVDTDRRPDINARYNMGGWPTTVFLTPTGHPLYGETYVTPQRMTGLLKYVANYYKTNASDIAARLAEHEHDDEPSTSKSQEITTEAVSTIAEAIVENYDSVYGGFGAEPKFPHVRALEFALDQAARGRADLGEIVAATLTAMAGGGTYDPFAGGFFRYSTTRDWRIPHFEKMLEDNTQLAALCFKASAILGDEHLAEIGRDVHQWLFSIMHDPATGCFAGSQDADKEDEYYGKPLDERAKLPTPYIDWTIYTGWNAYMVSSLVARYKLDGDAAMLEPAVKVFDFLQSHVAPHHYFVGGKAQGTANMLADLVALIAAALDLNEVTGDGSYLGAARTWASHMLTHLQDDGGGFHDIEVNPAALGALSKPKVEMNENADATLALTRLARATGDTSYRVAAQRAIARFAGEYARWTFYGAAYGRAVAEFLAPDIEVVIAGANGDELRQAAWTLYATNVRVTVDPRRERYPNGGEWAALAYVCVGTVCRAPVSTPEDLIALLKEMTA